MLMEMPEIEHVNARDFKEALYWLDKYGEKARVMAGATDLLGMMKDRIQGPGLKVPEVLINIKAIPEMDHISYDENQGLRIGAAVTLDRIVESQVINGKFGVLSQAAGQVGSTQLRNMGTIGGNVCQRPRCTYFRHSHFICRKKGGDKCYAIPGEHREYYSIMKYGKCIMAHPSDMAPALASLNAKAMVVGPDGAKEINLQDLFLGPNNIMETSLKPNELLLEFVVPKPEMPSVQCFIKHRIRRSFDFALSSVAAVARIDKGVCKDLTIVLGGIAPFPYVPEEAAGELKGKEFSDELISKVAEVSVKDAHPLPMNGYKVGLTKAIVRRGLKALWQE